MNYQFSYKLFSIGAAIGFGLVLLYLILPYDWIAICGIAIMILSLILAQIFVRCPNCGRSLLIQGKKPDFCPGCGVPLEW